MSGHVVMVAMAMSVVSFDEFGVGGMREAAEEQRVSVAATCFPDNLCKPQPRLKGSLSQRNDIYVSKCHAGSKFKN